MYLYFLGLELILEEACPSPSPLHQLQANGQTWRKAGTQFYPVSFKDLLTGERGRGEENRGISGLYGWIEKTRRSRPKIQNYFPANSTERRILLRVSWKWFPQLPVYCGIEKRWRNLSYQNVKPELIEKQVILPEL